MIERLTLKEMGVEHVAQFGKMLANMVSESPRNFSVSHAYLLEYGSSERFMTGMTKSIQANKAGRFVVETEVGRCVAGVETVIRGESLRIGNMYVIPEFRSRGLGSKLLQACEERAFRDEFRQTSLVVGSENDVALTFYSDKGYANPEPPVQEPWELHPGVYGELLCKAHINKLLNSVN